MEPAQALGGRGAAASGRGGRLGAAGKKPKFTLTLAAQLKDTFLKWEGFFSLKLAQSCSVNVVPGADRGRQSALCHRRRGPRIFPGSNLATGVKALRSPSCRIYPKGELRTRDLCDLVVYPSAVHDREKLGST